MKPIRNQEAGTYGTRAVAENGSPAKSVIYFASLVAMNLAVLGKPKTDNYEALRMAA